MIAIDTNLLVYAHSGEPQLRQRCRALIETAASDPRGWGVAAASVAEFWMVATHRASGDPATPAAASEFLRELERTGGMRVFLPSAASTRHLLELAVSLGVTGARIFDLQIALQARDSGATELWTNDRSFRAPPDLRVHHPALD
ncbi:MAG: PIN domain-containing protein [Myxococcota bacterium]